MRKHQYLWVLAILFVAPLAAQDTQVAVPALDPQVQTAEWAKRWWMPRHEEKLAALKKNADIDLVFIGDSITHGWENAGKKVWQQYYQPRKAFNLGFSGDRTEQVLWRLQHGAVDGIQPELAVIMIGTNNAGHRQDPAKETAAGIQAILDDLAKRLPDTKVLLLAIFPRGAQADDGLRKLNRETNDLIETYADDKKVFYLNINSAFLEDDGSLPKAVMPDLLHPNEQGYTMWAEAMEPAIAKLMASDD